MQVIEVLPCVLQQALPEINEFQELYKSAERPIIHPVIVTVDLPW